LTDLEKSKIVFLSNVNTDIQNQINNKVNSNSPLITPATKTKVTYDAKGLVLSGSDATASDFGLGNVDNTSDANKPISTATQTALDLKSDKNITLNRKTASYVLVATDNNKLIEMDVAGANTVTINDSLFTAGNQILVSQYGIGETSFVAGAGVTIRSDSGKLKMSSQYSLATIIAISSTEFYLSGNLKA
jgi:hypothetical protein